MPTTSPEVLGPDRSKDLEEHFARNAAAIDRGDRSTRDALRFLGRRNLLALGTTRGAGTLTDMVEVICTVARSCMSSAFSAWAQRMVLEYLDHSDSRLETDTLVEGLACGEESGSTAMASAFEDLAGLRPLPVTFDRDRDTLRLNGKLRWASNLFDDGFWVVLAARDRSSDERVVVVVPSSDPGLRVADPPQLLALNATASSSLVLTDVAVPPERVMSRDIDGFLASVRQPFLCLQASFCLGLAEASLAAIEARPDAGYGQFAEERRQLGIAAADVSSRLHRLAAGTVDGDASSLPAMRLHAAQLASTAVALEMKVTGGAAYLEHSAAARRLREAAFLPIQSPTEAYLRWELAQSRS